MPTRTSETLSCQGPSPSARPIVRSVGRIVLALLFAALQASFVVWATRHQVEDLFARHAECLEQGVRATALGLEKPGSGLGESAPRFEALAASFAESVGTYMTFYTGYAMFMGVLLIVYWGVARRRQAGVAADSTAQCAALAHHASL